MVSLFSSLNIAAGALNVNESAISVVSHNVANMNTEGYSKQRVNLATRNLAGAIGNNVEAQIRANGGVKIANVMRYNDDYLNGYYRDQLSRLKELEEQLGNVGDLANLFNDLDGQGVNGALTDFFEAVNNLNEYPASSTARTNFVQKIKTLTDTFNSKSKQLDQLTGRALGDGESQEALESSKIYSQYTVLNNTLKNLAEVNKALQSTQTGTLEANNLLDKRDMILNDIAEFIDVTIEEKDNGSVNIYLGDTPLVKGSVVTGEFDIQTAKSYCKENGLTYPDDWIVVDDFGKPVLDEYGKTIPREAAVMSIVKREGNTKEIVVADANDQIRGGSIGGLLHSADLNGEGMNVGKAKQTLNTLVQAIADVFNKLNTREGAYCIDSSDSGKLIPTDADNLLFVGGEDGTINADNFTINPKLLSDDGIWNICCAYFDDPANFDERAVGNAQNAVDMLNARTQKLLELNNLSLEDYYTNFLGKIAASGSSAQNLLDTQQDVVDGIYNKIKSNNSVDLNEELVDLVKYQTAYAAAAQVFNVCNNCLETLMTLGR